MAQIYIAGIGTDVGKTHASALFCQSFGYGYCKLIQAGMPEDRDFIKCFTTSHIFPNGITLRTPTSPHIAKILEQKSYNITDINLPSQHDAKARHIVIELAGGLFTPIDESMCMIDYMCLHKKPCILVGRYYLGCINHVLLSIEALKARDIAICCVIMMKEDITPKRIEPINAKHDNTTSTITHNQPLIDEFLEHHTLFQDIPLLHAHFFTKESFMQACKDFKAIFPSHILKSLASS